MLFELGVIAATVTAIAVPVVALSYSADKLLEATDLAKKPFVKKALSIIGVEVLDLSEEERMGIIEKLDYEIKEFVEEWRDGDSNVFSIPLFKLELDTEAVGFKKELQAIEDGLCYLQVVENVGVCEEDFYLQLTIEENVLKAFHEARLQEWRTQGELERLEYFANRGVC